MAIDPVHLLLGPESGQKNEHIEKIRATITKEQREPPEEHRIYPYKLEVVELIGLLNNNSLFSKHKLVFVLQAEELSKKSDVTKIADYISAPSGDSTLILLSDAFHIDPRIEKAATKKRVKIFWELFENQKRSFVHGFFRSEGRTITQEAVDLILELVENDTADLRRECEKILLFFTTSEIGADEVEELIFHSKNESVFSLFDRIAEADLESAIETLHALILAGSADAGQIVGGLTWQIRRLLAFRQMKDQHYADEEIARTLKIRGKRNIKVYQTGCSHFSSAELERAFLRTTEYDSLFRQIRTGIDQKLLELYLYEIIVSRGKRPLVNARAEKIHT